MKSRHYFAPGAIEGGRRADTWGRALLTAVALLALAALVGFVAGWLDVKGLSL